VQVGAGGGHRAVAERGLNQVDGRAVVERMAGVCVSEPVGANGAGNADSPGRLPHDHADVYGRAEIQLASIL
jgi:hypothetical protein